MERIVVAVKAGSDQPWLADAAAQLANQTGAAVAVVSVDEVESQRYAPMPRQVYMADAERAVASAAERLAAAGVEVTTQVRTGPALEQILAFLEESEADLVVVGSASRGRLATALLGNVPLGLLQRSQRPVLVVTGPPGGG